MHPHVCAPAHITITTLAPHPWARAQIMQTAEWQEYVDVAFSRLDVDGDGYIELTELLARMPEDFLRG